MKQLLPTHPPSLKPWKPPICLLSMDLPLLGILYKWSHILVIYDLLGLTPSLVHIWGNRIKLGDFMSGEKIT